MALPNGLQQLGKLKVSEVPGFAKQIANQGFIKQKLVSWAHSYHQKYILTSSIRPLNDTLIVVGLFSYAVGWPTEIRHLRHQEEEERLKRAGLDVKGHH